MYRTFLLAAVAILALVNVEPVEANWPQFHGSSAGVSEDGILP